MNKSDINQLLSDIGLSAAEANVYVALLDGANSAQAVMKATGEKRPTVYYCLNSLEKRGLVSKTGKDYGNKFQVEPVERLTELVERNIRTQNQLLEQAKALKDYYPEDTNSLKSMVSYFDTLETIKSAIFFSLYGKEKMIRTIVPTTNFFHEMGRAFVEEYVTEKKKRGIHTIALWEDIPKKNVIEKFYTQADIRQLPVSMHNSFDTTVFMYDDKTLYVSPKKEKYAVLIQSEAHARMMRSMFDTIWSTAFELGSKPKG